MDKAMAWRRARMGLGAFFLLLVAGWGLFLYRMAVVRDAMAHPESGLFLARAVVLMAMAGCLLMAVWCFVSLKAAIKSQAARRLLLVAGVACGLACLAFCVWVLVSVSGEYAQWPGGALF